MKNALAAVLVAPLVVLYFAGAIVLGLALCVPGVETLVGWGFDTEGNIGPLSRGGWVSWLVCAVLAGLGLSILGAVGDKLADAWADLRGHAKAAGGPIAH